jgi:plasmid stabilization system protein ParE
VRSSSRLKRGTIFSNSTITSPAKPAPRARACTGRIVSYCLGFTMFPERGRRRDDLLPGLRVIGFGRRVTISFHIAGDRITIDRVLCGGRDLTRAFRNPGEK